MIVETNIPFINILTPKAIWSGVKKLHPNRFDFDPFTSINANKFINAKFIRTLDTGEHSDKDYLGAHSVYTFPPNIQEALHIIDVYVSLYTIKTVFMVLPFLDYDKITLNRLLTYSNVYTIITEEYGWVNEYSNKPMTYNSKFIQTRFMLLIFTRLESKIGYYRKKVPVNWFLYQNLSKKEVSNGKVYFNI